MKPLIILTLVLASLVSGCQSAPGIKPEKGPGGTIVYQIMVESNTEGARVEVNGDYIGKTPISVKVFGDRDGTFHDFGTEDFVIRVFPVKTGQKIQTKVFRTGRWFSAEDKIPTRLYFDLDLNEEGFTIDVPKNPEEPKKTP